MQANLEKKEPFNAWPYAIVGGIIFIIIACAVTIKIALDNPVQLDGGFYLSKYQDVDDSINELLAKQKVFDEAYSLDYGIKKITMGAETMIPIAVRQKSDGISVDSASIRLLVTRPDSNVYNMELTPSGVKDGYYLFGPVKVELPGRWQLLSKVSVGEKEGFLKHEIFAAP